MPHKGPHISILPDYVVNRILRIDRNDFEEWPESVRNLAIAIAEELFLVAYNPFIDAETVRQSVQSRYEADSLALAHHYATSIGEGITMFWSAHSAEMAFRTELIEAFRKIMPEECIILRPGALVENATDATDLRMELPICVVEPNTTEQVAGLVRLANDKKFALIPRGGGSGLTGGAVPARKRTVIVNLTRLTCIEAIDKTNKTVTCEAGVLTHEVIKAADKEGLFFSVDPASKLASSIGGNIAENAGGPCAFEYGTTIDNLLWWRMVTPTGEIITVERKDHPRHKILADDIAIFEVKDISGGVRNVVQLSGTDIRTPGLGKDVSNKALGGLPGIQKEGVDGIITQACFVLHHKPKFSRVMVLEFFGRSMHAAAVVIRELVAFRDRVREQGDYARLSALEEFNAKYVQAIEYKRKSQKFDSAPISVIILQIDGDEPYLLDKCVTEILSLVQGQDNVDILVAEDKEQAAIFWEDRHKLSAISKRTSGFKINEDVVIPIERIPDFAIFLEQLNLECAATAFRYALQSVGRLTGFALEDKEFNKEFSNASKAARGDVLASELSDEEMLIRSVLFLKDLQNKYPHLARKIQKIHDYMQSSRIIVASHMHAGDGNCHVNIPVNSSDHHMLEEAERVAARVMQTAQDMGGSVSGEHGIGITKIAFLSESKIEALRDFKERVDPRDILNPAKLVQRELPVRPFTFSFNGLIRDISESGLPGKSQLIHLLGSVQNCTRCGKCKHVCPMTYPERSMQWHPRNKNMVLGMLLEAIYYTQVNTGRLDEKLLAHIREMVEHCTACGRCTAVCPIGIPSGEVALALRKTLESEGAGGHPLKSRILTWLVQQPQQRIPKSAKMAALGQKTQNKVLNFVPQSWRSRFQNPIFSSKSPKIGYTNLYESMKLHRGHMFIPADAANIKQAVIYFPGCGASLFYDRIGMSSLLLLLKAGHSVIIPPKHLCCGYPLLTSGMEKLYKRNADNMKKSLLALIDEAKQAGLEPRYIATACGTCMDSLHRMEFLSQNKLEQTTVSQLALASIEPTANLDGAPRLYHAACHAEWAGLSNIAGREKLLSELSKFTGASFTISSGCCGESGLGSMTSPAIYNKLRDRKRQSIEQALQNNAGPILVSCPSCKVGIGRILLSLNQKRPVLHISEWLVKHLDGPEWRKGFKKRVNETRGNIREIDISQQ